MKKENCPREGKHTTSFKQCVRVLWFAAVRRMRCTFRWTNYLVMGYCHFAD